VRESAGIAIGNGGVCALLLSPGRCAMGGGGAAFEKGLDDAAADRGATQLQEPTGAGGIGMIGIANAAVPSLAIVGGVVLEGGEGRSGVACHEAATAAGCLQGRLQPGLGAPTGTVDACAVGRDGGQEEAGGFPR
jgi:hypothetical protein